MRRHAEFLTVPASAIVVLGTLFACKSKKAEPAPTAVATSPSAPTTTEGTPTIIGTNNTVHKLGETASTHDYNFTVVNVKECKVKYYFKPKTGNIKLGAEVVIEGTANKQIPVNPFYAKVTDSESASYSSTFAGCEPELKSLQVSKGEQSRGFITFELPEKAAGLKLTYAPFVIGGGKQEVVVDLGR
jgi:hypothetical protein